MPTAIRPPSLLSPGNVPSHLLGKNAFQEVDIVGITAPITKKNYLVRKVSIIPEVVREAFAIAGGNRPGPVLIDIPKDIQQQYPRDFEGNYVLPRIPAVIEMPESHLAELNDDQIVECCRMLAESRRPVIYAGGGIVSSNSCGQLLKLAEHLQCPVTTTLMGHGAFPPAHPLALHCLGMHGSKYANTAINEADVVIAVGVRFDDRVTGNVSEFIKHGKIIHIDVDRNELNKNKTVTLPICADVAKALAQLSERAMPGDYRVWREYLASLREQFPFCVPQSLAIKPQYAIRLLSDMTRGEAIVTLGVGQHQMWAMQHYRSARPRSFLSSSGFGTMGYGLPAAIGAKVACPDRMVIDIDGDGSFNMTVQELATCRRYKIGVKIVIINNQWLGMVRQWQDMIYHGHRAGTAMADPLMDTRPEGETDIYPDFVTIAAGYRIRAVRVAKPDELPAAFARLLADPNEPYLLDVIVDADENVYPMIPAGGTFRDIIMSEKDMQPGVKGKQGSSI